MRRSALALLLLTALASAIVLLAGPRAQASPDTTFTVNSTADSGSGTLRQALLDAQSGDTIVFDTAVFPPSSPATISLGSTLPSLGTGNVTVDGASAGVIIDGVTNTYDCLGVTSNGNAIKGLEIYNCGNGVYIHSGAQNNTIGGSTAAERNVISGNGGAGVHIDGSGTDGNTVKGNYIGTNRAGTAALRNQTGVMITNGAENNTVGGSTAPERNVLSGNEFGVALGGDGTSGNVVEGNYIGTDASGAAAVANTVDGVVIANGADSNTVRGNVASGNGFAGVVVGRFIYKLSGSATQEAPFLLEGHLEIKRNGEPYKDLDGDGMLKPEWVDADKGFTLQLTASTPDDCGRIGPLYLLYLGTWESATLTATEVNNGCPGASGEFWSTTYTIAIPAASHSASGNVIEGNLIGTNATGDAAIPNGQLGIVVVENSADTLIGGTDASGRNVISGNVLAGIAVWGDPLTGTRIIGNYVGTKANGVEPLPNAFGGIAIGNGAQSTTIGGTETGEGNTIAYNGLGVSVDGATTTGNTMSGNSIHSNGGKGIDLTNLGNTELAPPIIDGLGGSVHGHTNPKCYPCTVEVFSDYEDEGRIYHGWTTTNNDATGTWVYPGTAGGRNVTATVTDSAGNTSEFSDPFPFPVGGIAELLDASGSSTPNYVALAGLAAAALLAVTAGGWYAKRRWLR